MVDHIWCALNLIADIGLTRLTEKFTANLPVGFRLLLAVGSSMADGNGLRS